MINRLTPLSLLLLLAAPLLADPCGMVPPIYTGEGPPITRIGEQQTYVFYKDGVEAFVIRPGFSGKVDEFGMLIPFPTPPAIRKVPDAVFAHLAAAVDPPEVVVDLTPRPIFLANSLGAAPRQSGGLYYGHALDKDEVQVLREEAVGMYEVAVLAAGSPEALKRWMDDHGYRYPDGMDKPCGEYVAAGWCFVAVKTQVGTKSGADPAPGQKEVENALPAGSAFDGHVQGMGFRFETEELVVPMRLSAFNAGELRNIVYLLTDGPRKIRAIPEEYVVRQISGKQILANVSQPLPLRIIGGTEKDIPDDRLKALPQERDPAPHNGIAKELFAADLLAAKSGELSLPHEEREKELLQIGERLSLRGAEIDALHEQSIAEERKKTVDAAIADARQMTLTVVDGDFPREVLGGLNLTFAEYKMPASRNKPEAYDAKIHGPAGEKPGLLKTGRLDLSPPQNQPDSTTDRGIALAPWMGLLLAPPLIGLALLLRRRLKRKLK